ncbi:hypothetical protein GCM10027026_19820 [Myroides odoratimimus subsp. xuanwuensis]
MENSSPSSPRHTSGCTSSRASNHLPCQSILATVRVNTISAGPFLTDISDHWPAEARERSRSSIGRPGTPSEIVTTALYLASPASSYTTGALIRVDGGLY